MNILSIPRDNRNDILDLVTLADLAQIRGVCKELKLLADTRFLEIAEGIQGLDQNPSKPLHKRVLQHVNNLKQYIKQLPEDQVPKEIVEIASKEIFSIDEINLLQAFQKARDTLVVWIRLGECTNLKKPKIDWSNLDNIFLKSEKFNFWFCKHTGRTFPQYYPRISFLKSLDLSGLFLQYLPDQIGFLGVFRDLQHLDLKNNLFLSLPREITNLHLMALNLSSNVNLSSLPPEVWSPTLQELQVDSKIFVPDSKFDIKIKELQSSKVLRISDINNVAYIERVNSIIKKVSDLLIQNRRKIISKIAKLMAIYILDNLLEEYLSNVNPYIAAIAILLVVIPIVDRFFDLF